MTTKGDLTRQHILEKSMQLFSVQGILQYLHSRHR